MSVLRSSLALPFALVLPLVIAVGCSTTVDPATDAPDAAVAVPGEALPAPVPADGDAGTKSDGAIADAHDADHDAADAKPPPPPPPTETCTPVGNDCVSGPSLEYCTTFSSTTGCVSNAYKRGAQVYSCASCLDCTAGHETALVACQGATGSCKKLSSCCNVISPTYQPSCQSAVAMYKAQYLGELSCQSLYETYQQQGLCP